MSRENTFEQDLASIRNMMERSNKFLSLSGLSGVLAGVYALLGSVGAYLIVYYPNTPFGYRFSYINEQPTLIRLLLIASAVLFLSLTTGLWFSLRKAHKLGTSIWDNNGRRMLINTSIPLVAGGLFILTLVYRGHYGIVAPSCLLFYGIALLNASNYTLSDVRYLGICEIILGVLCAMLPGYGLIFWALGFGILHIVYGIIMHNKYDK